MALFHNPDGRGKSFHRVTLVCTKRHVAHHQCAVCALDDALGMINHLVEGDWQCGHIAGHDIRGRVADQYHVDTGLVNQLCHREVISCKHGDFLATTFHLYQARGRHLALFVNCVCRHSYVLKFMGSPSTGPPILIYREV